LKKVEENFILIINRIKKLYIKTKIKRFNKWYVNSIYTIAFEILFIYIQKNRIDKILYLNNRINVKIKLEYKKKKDQ